MDSALNMQDKSEEKLLVDACESRRLLTKTLRSQDCGKVSKELKLQLEKWREAWADAFDTEAHANYYMHS